MLVMSRKVGGRRQTLHAQPRQSSVIAIAISKQVFSCKSKSGISRIPAILQSKSNFKHSNCFIFVMKKALKHKINRYVQITSCRFCFLFFDIAFVNDQKCPVNAIPESFEVSLLSIDDSQQKGKGGESAFGYSDQSSMQRISQRMWHNELKTMLVSLLLPQMKA